MDAAIIAQKVVGGIYSGVTTVELDNYTAKTAFAGVTKHPDFNTLAARISVSNMHKQTSDRFSDVVDVLYKHIHPQTNKHTPLVSEELYKTVIEAGLEILL